MHRDGYLNESAPRLHYVDRGAGGATSLVLLHGLQDCAANWDAAATAKATDRWKARTRRPIFQAMSAGSWRVWVWNAWCS
jgi:pimeloyl-ACP methyl ester carboxylesterase